MYCFYILQLLYLCNSILAFKLNSRRITMTETLAEDKKMNNFERIDRILSFYSKAVPVFASYKILEASLDLQRNYLPQKTKFQ